MSTILKFVCLATFPFVNARMALYAVVQNCLLLWQHHLVDVIFPVMSCSGSTFVLQSCICVFVDRLISLVWLFDHPPEHRRQQWVQKSKFRHMTNVINPGRFVAANMTKPVWANAETLRKRC